MPDDTPPTPPPATSRRPPVLAVVVPLIALAVHLVLHSGAGPAAAAVLVAALLGAVLSAVHHAEVVARRVGEPFGAVLLALAVTVIELGLIVSIMFGGQPEPTLLRDTIHAAVVLVLHGVAGLCIVVGALRHREQDFSTRGAQAYLTVLLPMVALTLVLPNFTTSLPGPYYTATQLAFVSASCLVLWLAFTFVQTVRHREYFLPLPNAAVGGVEAPAAAAPERPSGRRALASLLLLLVSLSAVVLLAKDVSPYLQSLVANVGAPAALVGVIVAAIVLMPEGMTAVRAAKKNQLQTSINLALGSGVASIGLTVPAVSLVAWWTDTPVALGVTPGGAVLLGLSFLMAILTYGNGRASLLSGVVHLILLATWLFLIVVP